MRYGMEFRFGMPGRVISIIRKRHVEIGAGVPEGHSLEIAEELNSIAVLSASPAPVSALAIVLDRPDMEAVHAAALRAGSLPLAAVGAGNLLDLHSF